jgi:hypothetical protein
MYLRIMSVILNVSMVTEGGSRKSYVASYAVKVVAASCIVIGLYNLRCLVLAIVFEIIKSLFINTVEINVYRDVIVASKWRR